MTLNDEIYNYIQDTLNHGILPSAYEISKICESKYIKKEDVMELIDIKIQELQNEINDVERSENVPQFFKTYENMFILKALRKLREVKEEIK